MYIRTRLALWFMLILSVVLTAFSVTIYQLTKSNLLTEIDTDVRQRAAMLTLATHPYPEETTMRVPKLDVFASPDIYLQVLDQRGRVLGSSGNLGNRTLPLMRDAITADQVREARVGRTLLFVYGRAVIVHNQLRKIIPAVSRHNARQTKSTAWRTRSTVCSRPWRTLTSRCKRSTISSATS